MARNGFELPSVAVSVVVISRCLDGYVVFRIAIVKRLCSLCGELNDVGLSEQARVGLDKAHTFSRVHEAAHTYIFTITVVGVDELGCALVFNDKGASIISLVGHITHLILSAAIAFTLVGGNVLERAVELGYVVASLALEVHVALVVGLDEAPHVGI